MKDQLKDTEAAETLRQGETKEAQTSVTTDPTDSRQSSDDVSVKG